MYHFGGRRKVIIKECTKSHPNFNVRNCYVKRLTNMLTCDIIEEMNIT